jgi:hypothetical protein
MAIRRLIYHTVQYQYTVLYSRKGMR